MLNAESKRLRTEDAATYLGLARKTLEKDRSTGEFGIPFIKLNRAVLYDTGDLDRFMAERKHNTPCMEAA